MNSEANAQVEPSAPGRAEASSPAPAPAPVSETERIQEMDVLRGFALLGILSVNMAIFSFPAIAYVTGTPRGTSPLDTLAEFVIWTLATSKFYPLFSFLFGLGMSIQLARATERGAKFTRLYARRLLVLMLFGLLHALLVWNGDILFLYALLGFPLILFRNTQPKTLLICAAALIAVPVILGLGGVVLGAAMFSLSGAEAMGGLDINRMLADLQRITIEVYARGTWGQIFVWRAVEWLIVLLASIFNNAPHILGLFLLGLYAGKTRLFQDIPAHLPLFRRLMRVGLLAGLPANALIALLSLTTRGSTMALWSGLAQTLLLVFGPLLTAGYIGAFVLLMQRAAWRRLLAPLAAAGRMALSNYLMQSIVCTTLFYSYGLGLFGQVGAFVGLLLSLGLWLAQLPISVFWLRAFLFGPAEWLWRSLTYGKRQPMKRA